MYPYLRDVINDAITKKERLFLSHFTSTTHHPWSTPKNFHKEQYFPGGRLIGKHEDMNDYLNAVRYVDTWLGDFFQVLDDTGIANETLVVLVGDQYVTSFYKPIRLWIVIGHKLTQSQRSSIPGRLPSLRNLRERTHQQLSNPPNLPTSTTAQDPDNGQRNVHVRRADDSGLISPDQILERAGFGRGTGPFE